EPPSVALSKFANQFSAFQKPGVAEAELEKDPRIALRRFYYALSGDAPPDIVKSFFTPKSADVGVLDGMPDLPKLPVWLTEADLDYYAEVFSRTGFRGPLNLYRTMQIDWHELPQLGTTRIVQPTLFMGGKREPAIMFGQFDPMISAVPRLRAIVFLETCGHC